jgi:hypothetical protein
MTPITARVAALHTLIGDRWPGGVEDRMCAELARTLPRSLAHMVAVTPDGFPTSTPGAPDRANGARGSAELTSVESATHHRTRSTRSYTALCVFVGDAAARVALMDRMALKDSLRAAQAVVDEWQPPMSAAERETAWRNVRCSASVDMAGYMDWSLADCENVAAPGRQGLCTRCHMRRYRWIKAQDEVA